MLLGSLKNSFQGMRSEVKFTRIALILAIFSTMVTSCSALRRDQPVVVVPPTMTEKAWVSKTQAQDEYTIAWALYIAMMLGNVTPQNADIVKQAIGPLLDPSIYQETMAAIDKQIQQIRQDRVSTHFEGQKVLRDNTNPNKFFVTGHSVAEGPAGDRKRENRTYEFELKIHDYHPVISWLSTNSGEARTQDVLDREAENAERLLKRQQKHKG
ncbi:TraE/TraK family type IV conjugative transfer system protein [Pseudomonas aeruginosa]|uniref:TraE/TraK family type IV conjugative transfer system protein n=1 Tax=Pseudomonas aeruginosa TaxID=287 RepID=UPI002E2E3F18|nr:TraE/TraK family type IV conjugative transfer system protein [Pseudomonas aeruginosa]